MSPIDLLKERLFIYERALKHSLDSYKKGEIPKELHESHKQNLEPKIQEYKFCIRLLEPYC